MLVNFLTKRKSILAAKYFTCILVGFLVTLSPIFSFDGKLQDSDYIFFSDKSYSGYISDSVVLKYLRACGVTKEETTLNGFRTSALTIGEEALGIGIGILKKRAEAMQKWADYCDQCKNPWKVKPVSSTKKFLWQK